jgi:hypothetical protein
MRSSCEPNSNTRFSPKRIFWFEGRAL